MKTDISEIEALKQANQVRRRQHDLAGRAGLTGPRWAILTELVRADGEGPSSRSVFAVSSRGPSSIDTGATRWVCGW